MIIKALREEGLPVYGDGENIRDWLYVEDHAKALALVLEVGRIGETYNVGGRNERSNISVTKAICDLIDGKQPSEHGSRQRLITFVADRPGHDRRYALDPSKLENELGWRAVETFESGLVRTVNWYLRNRSWWMQLLDRARGIDEVQKRRAAW
jgi:dTDP-glucose 4,6-dehydratase